MKVSFLLSQSLKTNAISHTRREASYFFMRAPFKDLYKVPTESIHFIRKINSLRFRDTLKEYMIMKLLIKAAAFMMVAPSYGRSLTTTTSTRTNATVRQKDQCSICVNSVSTPLPDALIPKRASLLEDIKTCQEFQSIANTFTKEDDKCQSYFQRIGFLYCGCDEPFSSTNESPTFSTSFHRTSLQEEDTISNNCKTLVEGEYPEDMTSLLLNRVVEEHEFTIYLDVSLSNDQIQLQHALKTFKHEFDSVFSTFVVECNVTRYDNEHEQQQQQQQQQDPAEEMSYSYSNSHIWSVHIFPNDAYDYYTSKMNQVPCIEPNHNGRCTSVATTVRALFSTEQSMPHSFSTHHIRQLKPFLKGIITNELPLIIHTIDAVEQVVVADSASNRNLIDVTSSPTFEPTFSCDDVLSGIYSYQGNVQTFMLFSFDLTLYQDILPDTVYSDIVDLFNRKISAFAAGCEVFSHLEDETLAIYNQYEHPNSVQEVYRVEFSFTSNYFSEGDFTLIDGECESTESFTGTSCYPSTGFVSIYWDPFGGVNNSTLNNDLEGFIFDVISAEMQYLSNDITDIHSIFVSDIIAEPSIAPSILLSFSPDCESLLDGIFVDSIPGIPSHETSYFMYFDVTPSTEGNLTDVLLNLKEQFDRKISAFAAECIVENEGYTNDGPTIIHVQLFPNEDFDYYTLDDISCEESNLDLNCVPVLGVISISFISAEPVSTSTKEELIEYVKYIIEQELQSLVRNVEGLSSISIIDRVSYSAAPSISPDLGTVEHTDCEDLLSGKFPSLDETMRTTSLTMMMDLVLEAIVPFEDIRDSFEVSLENQVSAYAAGCRIVMHGNSGVDIVKEYDNDFHIYLVKFNMVLFHYGACSSTLSMSGSCYPMIVDVDIKYQPASQRLLGRLLGEADDIQDFVYGIIHREISSIAQDIAGIEAVNVIRSIESPTVTLNNGSKAAIGLSVSISIIAMSIYTVLKMKKKRSEKEFDGPITRLNEFSLSTDDAVLRNWNSNTVTTAKQSIKHDPVLSDNDLAILRQWNSSSSVRPISSEKKQMKLSQFLVANTINHQNEMGNSLDSTARNRKKQDSNPPNSKSLTSRIIMTETNNDDDDDLSVDESCNCDDFVDNDDDISVTSQYTI